MIKNFLLREKPAKYLILLLDNFNGDIKTISWLQRKTEATFSHTKLVVDRYINEDLVTKEKKGRINMLSLTVKGREIAERLRSLYNFDKNAIPRT